MVDMISLVVPVFNEEEVIEQYIRETVEILETSSFNYEIIFVDDGSVDRTVDLIKNKIKENLNIRLVVLAYNHGKEYAVSAAISHGRGDYFIYMDPDLQDPPEAIPELVGHIKKGNFDVVYGVRTNRKDSLMKKAFSYVFWTVLRRMTGLPIPNHLSVYRVFTKKFADRFLEYREADRFIEGIFFRIRGNWTTYPVAHKSRVAGQSKFTFSKRIMLAVNAALDFSEKPLYLMARYSALIVFGSVIAIITLVILKFYINFRIGWPSLVVLILMTMGVQLFSLSVVGLYVGKIYKEVKRRPLYSILEKVNVEN